HRTGENAHCPTAWPARVIVARSGEAGADHDVGIIEPGEQRRDVPRVVLTVGVYLDDDGVPIVTGETEAGAHGTPHAEVERQLDHGGSGIPRDLSRGIH